MNKLLLSMALFAVSGGQGELKHNMYGRFFLGNQEED